MPPEEKRSQERPSGILNAVDRISTNFRPEDGHVLTQDAKDETEPHSTKAENGFKLKKFELQNKSK